MARGWQQAIRMLDRSRTLWALLLCGACYRATGPDGDPGGTQPPDETPPDDDPGCEIVALRAGAEVDYAATVREGEPVHFRIETEGPRCCGGSASLREERRGNEIELYLSERVCEAECCDACRCVDGFTLEHDLQDLAPGDYLVRIGDETYPLHVIADPDACRLSESTPTAVEIEDEVCANEPTDVVIDHEADGCGCNTEYGIRWTQSGYTLDVISEVRYCPTRCYDGQECTDRFRSRGALLFATPGSYVVRAGSAQDRIEVRDCL